MVNRVPRKIIVPIALVLMTTALAGCMSDELWEPASPERSAHRHSGYGHSEQGHDHDNDHDDDNDPERRDPAEAYPDGSPRYHNALHGDEESRRTVDVPLGTETLRVALIHESCGDAAFTLWNPSAGAVDLPLSGPLEPAAEERVDGTKYMDEPDWVLIHDPIPGDWLLEIDIDGHSSYTVSFYIEEA